MTTPEAESSDQPRLDSQTPVAILTTTTALIHMALVIFLAGNIKEVGLAVEGPPMGDVHPGNMIASVVTFMFFVISFLYLLSYPGRSA